LDQKQSYAVISVSVERVRVFEAFLGQIAEISSYERETDTDTWRVQRHARRSPGIGIGVAARGGADVDSYQDRLDEATARMYRGLMCKVVSKHDNEDLQRVIISRTAANIAAFNPARPDGLPKRLVDEIQPPTNPDG